MKRNYEITVILRVDPNEEVLKEQAHEIQAWIEADGLGTVTKLDTWGRRKLAYEINKQREGFYLMFFADVEPKAINELERNMQIAQHIMRFMVIRAD